MEQTIEAKLENELQESSINTILEHRKYPMVVKGLSACSEAGFRDYNEDQILMKPKFTVTEDDNDDSAEASYLIHGPLSFFGVFDGHGGSQAAVFSREHVFINLKRALKNPEITSIRDSLRNAFVQTEKQFFAECVDDMSGSTANCVLISNEQMKLWCANAGDSRCVLSRNGKAIGLSNDHRFTNQNEIKRVQDSGGFVKNRRVLGRLECFRTIGDADCDPSIVISDPEVVEVALTEGDEFVVIACDGLFDVMSNSEVVSYIHMQLGEGIPIADISTNLARYSIYTRNSRDNVSIILVLFNQN